MDGVIFELTLFKIIMLFKILNTGMDPDPDISSK